MGTFCTALSTQKRTFLLFLTWSGPTPNFGAGWEGAFEERFCGYIKGLFVPKMTGSGRERTFLHFLHFFRKKLHHFPFPAKASRGKRLCDLGSAQNSLHLQFFCFLGNVQSTQTDGLVL